VAVSAANPMVAHDPAVQSRVELEKAKDKKAHKKKEK
jgi:hypothetical protein